MSTFKVGDVVRIIDNNRYSITSWGRVIRVSTNHATIYFEYTPNGELDTWTISTKDLELMVRKSKEELVLDKVRLIHSRQLKRGIIHV